MKSSHSHSDGSFSYFSSTSTTISYSFHNDHSTPPNSTKLPIEISGSSEALISNQLQPTAAATKIQSAYRSHRIRNLFRIIATVEKEANRIQHSIQRQETVDAIRSNNLEKLRMNEALMRLILKLDSVPGIDPTVREARRKVSHQIVGLQEILDAISEAKVDYYEEMVRNWEEMEEEICRERGGDELERFCSEYLGFRCLQRFLRE